MFKSDMCGTGRKTHQHFRAIVIFFSKMVDLFFLEKIPPNLGFYDEAMFSDVSLNSKRMTWAVNTNIFSSFYPSAFPARIVTSRMFYRMFWIFPFFFNTLADSFGRNYR